jgi:DNA modification methylase
VSAVVLRGDAAHLPLPDGSVDLIVTSPPYWKLRDYRDGGQSLDGQIGNEATPGEYIANLLTCTREWMRVLKPGGSIFVVLGDKYSQPGKGERNMQGIGGGITHKVGSRQANVSATGISYDGYPGKSLLFLPERYRIGCVTELGLIARAKIIWSKTNHMPESTDDRVCTAHEDVVHLVKQPRYFSAVDEIREPHQPQSIARTQRNRFAPDLSQIGVGSPNTLNPADACNPLGKLPGSVWDIATAPLIVPDRIAHARCCGGRKRKGCEDGLDHFAAYPPELCRRIIPGWSPSGICIRCDEGRRPVVEKTGLLGGDNNPDSRNGSRKRSTMDGGRREWAQRMASPDRIIGYACACTDISAPTRSAIVADPFGGTGTTSLVADVFGRTGITIDRSADYCRLAAWRTTDPGERARALGVPKPPPVLDGQFSFDDLEAS